MKMVKLKFFSLFLLSLLVLSSGSSYATMVIPPSWQVWLNQFVNSPPTANSSSSFSDSLLDSTTYWGSAKAFGQASTTITGWSTGTGEVTWNISLRLIGDPGEIVPILVSGTLGGTLKSSGVLIAGGTASVDYELFVEDAMLLDKEQSFTAAVAGSYSKSVTDIFSKRLDMVVGNTLDIQGKLIANASTWGILGQASAVSDFDNSFNFSAIIIPEPSTLILLGSGLVLLRRRRG
jgi:hypothetical protein